MEQRVCLNLASLKHLDYESALTASAKAGFRAVGLQEVQVERYLAWVTPLAKARLFLDSLGLAAPEMNFFPGGSMPAERQGLRPSGALRTSVNSQQPWGSESSS